jgi:hypothetical protein
MIMTAQAQNSINLYRGNPAGNILSALKFQKASVVNELKEHFGVSSLEALANKLSNY